MLPNRILFKDWSLKHDWTAACLQLQPPSPPRQTEKWQPCIADITLTTHASQPERLKRRMLSYVVKCEGATRMSFSWLPVLSQLHLCLCSKFDPATDDPTHLVQVGGNRAAKKHERRLWSGNLFGAHLLSVCAPDQSVKIAEPLSSWVSFFSLSCRRCFCQWKCARTNRICRIFLQIHTFYICPVERTRCCCDPVAVSLRWYISPIQTKNMMLNSHFERKNVGKLESQSRRHHTYAS